jgi:prepilin-type N-terminal cleavage/methylation domain-containing protein
VKIAKIGFTMIEVLIVIAIFGLLAAIAIPSFAKAKRTAEERRLQARLDKMTPAEAQNLRAVEQETKEVLAQKEMEKKLSRIEPFGPDVFYFPFGDMREFLFVLKAFQRKHPELQRECVEPDVIKSGDYDSSYGATVGHAVFFRVITENQ